MKKIILLLTVLTLGVIACDKNELGNMDEMSINPIEYTIEHDFDAAKATLENLMDIAVPLKGVKTGSTLKSGNILRLAVWSTTGNSNYIDGSYAHVTSEEYDACYDSYSPSFDVTYDWDTTTNELTIIMADGSEQSYPINGTLQDTYDNDFGNPLYFLARVDATSNGGYFVSGAQPSQVEAPQS